MKTWVKDIRWEAALLAAILLVALGLRLYQLDTLPAGPQHDEIFDSGFGLSIVQGDRPVFFDANGGVLPFFMYLLAPVIAAFGRMLLAVRSVAVACGMLGLLVNYLLVRELLGRWVALLTTAGLTVSFWYLFASRIALEPITLPLVAGLSFYLFWLGLRRGRLAFFVLSGLALGLSVYTYHSGPLIPLTLAVYTVYLLLFQRALLRQHFWRIVACALAAFLVAAPLGYYVLTHTDASASRLRDLAGHLQAAQRGDLGPLWGDAAAIAGMFGARGDPEWRYNLAGRPVFDPLGSLLFYGGLLVAMSRLRKPEYAFLLVWLPVNLLFSAITPPSPSTLRAIGGIVAVYAFPALAIVTLAEWGRRLWGQRGLWAVSAVAAGWLGLSGVALCYDYFQVWANHPEVRAIYRSDLAEAARYLDENDAGRLTAISAPYAADLDRQAFEMVARRPHNLKWFDGRRGLVWQAVAAGESVALVIPAIGALPADVQSRFLGDLQPAYAGRDPQGGVAFTIYQLSAADLAPRRSPQMAHGLYLNWDNQMALLGYDLAPAARSGGAARLTLYWRVLSQVHVPDSAVPIFFNHLLDSRDNLWGQDNYQPFYPSQWSRDDLVLSWFDLPVPVDAPPGQYYAAVGAMSNGKPLPVTDAGGRPLADRMPLGDVAVTRGDPPTRAVTLPIHFPRKKQFQAVTLLGVTGVESVRPGETWRIAIFWQATAAPPEDYTVALRFYGNSDEQILEWREVLLAGVYPTGRWRPGEYVRSYIYVPIPAASPPSKGRVKVNLYDASGRALGEEPGISVLGLAIGGQ